MRLGEKWRIGSKQFWIGFCAGMYAALWQYWNWRSRPSDGRSRRAWEIAFILLTTLTAFLLSRHAWYAFYRRRHDKHDRDRRIGILSAAVFSLGFLGLGAFAPRAAEYIWVASALIGTLAHMGLDDLNEKPPAPPLQQGSTISNGSNS